MKKIIGIIVAIVVIAGALIIIPQLGENVTTKYGLDELTREELVHYLEYDRDKPVQLQAQIMPNEINISDDKIKQTISLKKDDFYLSVAPYVNQTHPCTNHVPTGCQGELALRDFDVKIVGDDGTVYFDDTIQSAMNGFFGIWLPRNIEGTIYVTNRFGSASQKIRTSSDAPTCLTTLQLSN